MGKAEETKLFILETVAPFFNQHGYHGTSLSDLTRLTGLTKGALYGNFDNKEELAIEAFKFNVRRLVNDIAYEINKEEDAIEKLLALTSFYRTYISKVRSYGGCPILKVGSDNMDVNPRFQKKVNDYIIKLKSSISQILKDGITEGQIKQSVHPAKCADFIYASLQGAIFTAMTLQDQKVLNHVIDTLEDYIHEMKQ